MNDEIPLATGLSIREAKRDEYWLQQQIFDNPACLGLGDLDAIDKERRQGTGGRLDILLKDPEDDTMYEVEVMLGETDETHIIRTIEYWDNEKRRWPQRQHFAVLVAEHINRRFFNVIHLLSHSIPIIAIQVSLLHVNGQRFLSFSKILDTYEEIDDGAPSETHNREYWATKAAWTLDTADALLEMAQEIIPDITQTYLKHYIALSGKVNYVGLHKRSGDKSLVIFKASDIHREKIEELLSRTNIVPTRTKGSVRILLDRRTIETHREVLKQVLELVKES